MNRGQAPLLKYLYESEADFIRRDEIIEAIRFGDRQSFVGVLSAFSNRVNNTEGITGETGYEAFIDRMMIDGEEHFQLRDDARHAIERVPALQDVFQHSMDALLDHEGLPVTLVCRMVPTSSIFTNR